MSFPTSQGFASKNLGQFANSKGWHKHFWSLPVYEEQPSLETAPPHENQLGFQDRLLDSNQRPGCTPHSLHDLSLTLPTACPIFKMGITNPPTSLQPICLVCKFSRAEAGFYLCVQHHIQPGPALGQGSRQDWNTKQWRYLDQTWTTRINNRKAAWYFFPCCLCFSVTCLFISKPQQTSNQAVKEADLWSAEHLGSC